MCTMIITKLQYNELTDLQYNLTPVQLHLKYFFKLSCVSYVLYFSIVDESSIYSLHSVMTVGVELLNIRQRKDMLSNLHL